MSMDPTLQIFFDEASDLLRSFEEGVLGLEENPGDNELLNAVFRAAHTLKGNSSMLGFQRVAAFTHTLEELLTRMRAATVAATPAIVTTLLAANDVLRALVAEARDGQETTIDGLDEVARALVRHLAGADRPGRSAISGGPDMAPCLDGASADRPGRSAISGGPEMAPALPQTRRPEAAPRPTPGVESVPAPPRAPDVAAGPRVLYEIRFSPRGELLQRGVNPAGILDGLRELGEMIRVDGDPASLPPLAEMDPGRVYVAFTCWLMSRAPRAEIETCFEFADEPGAVSIDDLPMDDAVEAAVVPCLDQAGSDRPGPSAISGGPEMAPCLDIASADRPGRSAISGGPEMAPALPQARTAEAGSEAGRPAPAAERRQADRRQGDRRQGDAEIQSIRVATDKVDRLVNLVGELIITQSMIAQTLDNFDPQSLPRLREAVAQMDRHSRDLQERVMAVRMLPIKTVFGRFSRVVRDLAQSLGKRVQFETEGEETELDKTVIERISDPLTHLVRNAVDHGIESPADRVARGKPEAGHLTLAAYQQGGNIFIEIREDGQGLDRDRILAKALELGLVTPGESLTDEQIHALIFRPGFSTAREVTGVSGRGVGMDVVRRNVEALGGAIAIHSVRGQGTTFRIKLPLTLAILEGQLLRVGREVYVLPLVSITESVRPTRDMIAPVLSRAEAFIMRGEVLPLLRLHRVFQVPGAEEEPTRGLTVVVETDGRRAALLVDELLGQQQVVIKSLEVNFEKIDGVSGATILGDGRVALILDVPGLVGLAFRRSADPGAARAA